MDVDEHADSRTLGVSRKRDFPDVTPQYREPAQDYDSSDDEEVQRSRKRAKFISPPPVESILKDPTASSSLLSNGQDDSLQASKTHIARGAKPAHDTEVFSTAAEMSRASPVGQTEHPGVVIPAPLSEEGEGSRVPEDSTEPAPNPPARLSYATEAMEGLAPSLGESFIPSLSQFDPKNNHMAGWNGGVQSGLRTSFAAKSRPPSKKPEPSIESESLSNLLPNAPQGSAQVRHHKEDDSEEDLEDYMDSSNLGNGSNSTLFVPLSKKQLANLSLAERQAYKTAHKTAHKLHMKDQRLQTFHKHTAQAERALSRENGWPISQSAKSLEMINKGKTFYARDVEKALEYTNGSGTFTLSPIWDDEGKPIKLQDFSFNRFAPAFIKQNLDKTSSLNRYDLDLAFRVYCKKGFYRHLGAKCQPLMDTANADDALTLEQAMKLGGVPDHNPDVRQDTTVNPQGHIPSSGGDQASRNCIVESQSSNATVSSSASFVVLSNKDKKKLAPSELATYERGLDEHQRLGREAVALSATLEADRVIELVGKWPLPNKYQSISDNIARGNTFYPRKPKKLTQYKKGGKTFKIAQIFDDEGLPIKAEDFSFNKFSVAFLRQNSQQDKIDSLTPRHLKKAFGLYCGLFYHALSQRVLLQTAEARDAMTLEAAVKCARQPSQTSKPQKTDAPPLPTKPSERPPSAAGEPRQKDPPNHENKFPMEIGSQVHRNLGAASMNQHSDMQASSEPSGDNARMVGLKQLNYEARKVQEQHSSSSVAKTTIPSQSNHEFQRPAVLVADDNDIEMSNVMSLPSADKENGKEAARISNTVDNIRLQRKYFPSANTTLARCLACAGAGHGTDSCPALECTVCGMSGDHSDFTCPQNGRCRKCRQRGHQTTSCPEKLIPSKSEAIPCDMCGAKDHLEVACHFIWRSFTSGHDVKQVQDIPVHCYTCGGSGHYGAECGILTRPLLSGNVTWSRSNVQRYVDHSSEARALSAGIDYSIKMSKKQFNIKGIGGSADPYTIDDSEEDGEFIRPKIKNSLADRGHIRFGETLQSSYSTFGDINNRTSTPRWGAHAGFGSGYDDDYVPSRMPNGGPSSYHQPGGYSSYSSVGQHPSQVNAGNTGHSHELRTRSHPAAATVATSKLRPRKKVKKAKKGSGAAN